MKKLGIVLLLLALAAAPLAAQISFGVGPGAQYSVGRQYPLSLAYDQTWRCTLFGEAYVNIPLGWTLSLRPGLMYAVKEFNVTVVYSGRQHRTRPGTFRAGWVELPVLLVAQPVRWFHLGGGGYVAASMFRDVRFVPLNDVIYETSSSTFKPMCCPPPPPPPPKPIPNGNPVLDERWYDYGYILTVGLDWYIKCPTWTCKNSIDFTFSRGQNRVFCTYGRHYANQTLAASYIFWF